MRPEFAPVGIEALFEMKNQSAIRGNFVDQPETGVVASINVIGPGVTEADYQTNVCG
jgi:hypothetical protein